MLKKILFFLLITNAVFASNEIDSLTNLLNSESKTKLNDKEKVEVLNTLSECLFSKNLPKSLEYSQEAYKLAKKIDYDDGKLSALVNIGIVFYYKGDFEKTIRYFQTSLKIAQKKNNEEWIAMSYNNIANVYSDWKKTEKALEYYKKALETYLKIGNKNIIGKLYNNIGNTYNDIGDFEQAFVYLHKSLTIKENLNDYKGISNTISNIGLIHFKMENYQKSLDFFQQSLKYRKEIDDKIGIATVSNKIAEVQIHLGNLEDADKKLNDALKLANQFELTNLKPSIYLNLSNLYFELGDNKNALKYFKSYHNIHESIFNNESRKRIEELEKVESIKKEKLLEKNNKILQLEIDKQIFTKKIIVLIAILILLTGIFIYSRYRIKMNFIKLLSEKNEEIKLINNKLESLNEKLEERVNERTKKLKDEIVEKEKTQKSLSIALEKADEANRLKTEFLYNISHEIRTPLNSIIGFSGLLKTELENTKYKDLANYASESEKSGARLLNLLDNIIDISRLISRTLKINIQPLSTNNIINEVYELFTFKANAKGLKFSFIPSDIPNAIGDKELLVKVVSFIVDNAIKFTNKGSIEIKTGFLAKDNTVFIEISDTGIGISSKYQSKLFESFTQESKELGRAYEGAGLGLPLSKKIIELMDGEIILKSKKNVGTVVNLILPSFITPTGKGEDNIDRIIENIKYIKPNILIIEDDDSSGYLLEILLKKIAIIKLATNGNNAINIIKEYKNKSKYFDLILCDVNLPHPWDGIKLMKEIRKKWKEYKNTPIIAQTAYAHSSNGLSFIDEGFDAYISKPINKKNLIKIINEFIEKR